MSHPLKVTFTDDDDYALAVAYAKDRGIPLATIARSLVMSEVNRHAKRSGLLTAIEGIIGPRIRQGVADALAARPHVGERESTGGEQAHRWVGGEKEAWDVC